MSEERVRDLFEELQNMLDNRNPECINLLDDIRSISGTDELVRLIEGFDFIFAGENLPNSKKERIDDL